MRILLFILFCLFFQACKTTYDLVIENAEVFDTKQGVTLHNKTILINADTIMKVNLQKKMINITKNGWKIFMEEANAIRYLF
jgi:archaellum component FlaF (FlaF/FlaG flagellin family)